MGRNELKELMIALHLTRDLEIELDKNGAHGISLSDKIKSFMTMSEEDFKDFKNKEAEMNQYYCPSCASSVSEIENKNETVYYACNSDFNDENEKCGWEGSKDRLDYMWEDEDEDDNGYAYREYKRNLIGGHYNNLRRVAHERNQIMHKDYYTVNNFDLFKETIIAAIRYFNNSYQDSFNYSRNLKIKSYFRLFVHYIRNFIFIIFPIIISIVTIIYFMGDKLLSLKFNEVSGYGTVALWIIGIIFFSIIISGIFSVIQEKIENLIDFFIYDFDVFTSNKFLILLIILSYLLWDKKLQDIINIIFNQGLM